MGAQSAILNFRTKILAEVTSVTTTRLINTYKSTSTLHMEHDTYHIARKFDKEFNLVRNLNGGLVDCQAYHQIKINQY